MADEQKIEITQEELLRQIHKFANDPYIHYIKERDRMMSMMEVYGVNRKENNHSDFLAWLFNSTSDHKLGSLPADKLMKLLANIKCTSSSIDIVSAENDLSENDLLSFLTNSNEVIDAKASREVNVDGGRVDIVLELTARVAPNKIRVVFENKIMSSETNGDQTSRYYKHYLKSEDAYKNIFVYNRCNGTAPECKSFVCTTYQNIVDHIIEPLLQIPDINKRTKFVLKDYILALEKSVCGDKMIDNVVMAVGNDTIKLLKNFWESNSELISRVAGSLAAIEPENENFQTIAKATNDARRKYLLKFEGQEYSSLSQAGEAIIDKISGKIKTLRDLESIYSGKNRICKATDEFYQKNGERRFGKNPVIIDGENYFLRKEWAGETFKDFLCRLVETGFLDVSDVLFFEIINNSKVQIFPPPEIPLM